MPIVDGLETLWAWVIKTSWQGAVLVVLVLLVQRLFGKRLSPAWRHGLWYVVLIRLSLPVSVPSPISVFNLANAPSWRPVSQEIVEALRYQGGRAAERMPPVTPPGQTATVTEARAARTPSAAGTQAANPPGGAGGAVPGTQGSFAWSLKRVTGLGWLCGCVVLGLHFLAVHRRFAGQLRAARVVEDLGVRTVLADAAAVVGYRGPVRVLETTAVSAPGLFGLIRHRLLLPKGMLDSFSPPELRLVFLHELAHLKRGDLLVNWLMNLLGVLHWFNPLVWCGFHRVRNDCEEACDDVALRGAGTGERRAYGEAMVKLVERISLPTSAPGLLGILETKSQMERRISMIATFKKTNRWPGLAIAAFAGLALIALTDAQTKTNSSPSSAGAPSQPSLVDPKLGVGFTTVTTVAGANDEITTAERVVLSPNGKFLNWQGRVVPLDGSRPFSLTDRRVSDESWAPNGKLIACRGVDGLYVIPVDPDTGRATGPPKKLFSERVNLWGNQRLEWTRDSARIAFAAWNQDFSRRIAKAVSAGDGTVSDAPDWTELGVPSPDGKTIAYSPWGDGIWVRPVAGGAAKNLSATGQFKRCEPLAWSADGQWIIGHAGPGEGGDEVRLIRFADGQEFKIPVPESVGVFVGKSPAGDQVFFYRVSCDLAFVPKVMSIQGGPSVLLTARQPGLSIMGGARTSVTTGWADGMLMGYHWLPDGKSLVVTTVKIQSGTGGLWLFSFTGGEPIELKIELPGLNQLDYGRLAPNGDKLLLTAAEAGAMPACYVVPVSLREGRSSGPPVKLCNGSAEGAAWSPDGIKLAVIRDNEVWTVSGTTNNWIQHTKTAVPKRGIAWSPDGTVLAYHTYEPGKVELQVVAAPGGEPKSIFVSTRGPMRNLMWVWSPDSKSITLPEDGVIMQRSIAGNAQQQLLKLEDLGFAGVAWLAWAPDGRKLAFQATGSLTEQDTLFVWETRGGKPQKLDAPALAATQYAFAWSPDSQRLAYTSMEQPKTRLEGALSRLEVGEALKLAASGALPTSTSTNPPVRTPVASTNAVPIADSRFTDNFDTGPAASWLFWEDPRSDVPHEHAVQNGELVLENSRAILGEPDWTNYVVRTRIRLESAPATGEGVAGFSVRRTPDNPKNPGSFSLYSLRLVCSEGGPTAVNLDIGYHDPAGQLQIGRLDQRRPTLSLNKWYTLELEVKGRRLTGYLDGKVVAEGVDDRLGKGGIQLGSWNTRVRFDDLSVQLLP